MINTEDLNMVNGGAHRGKWKTVHGLAPADYLIVKSSPVADQSTDIGGLCNGDEVQIVGDVVPGTDKNGPVNYVYVYVAKFGVNGYVNVDNIW